VLQQLLELPIVVPNEPTPRRLAELNPEGLTAGRGIQSVASPTAIAAVGPEVEADAPNHSLRMIARLAEQSGKREYLTGPRRAF